VILDVVEEQQCVFESPGSQNVEMASGGILHFSFRVSVILDAMEERPLVFQSLGSLNVKTTNHFVTLAIRDEPMY
jgi:hypothetical protein